MNDFEREPVRGLPAFLPAGERILWQGGPNPWSLARRALLITPVMAYFALLAVWRFLDALSLGADAIGALEPIARLVPTALATLVILLLIGRWIAKTTLYTITNKRIVLRFGVALPMAINLPFEEIAEANVKRHADGSGTVVVSTVGNARLAFLHLWPNVRPWKWSPIQPALRCIDRPEDAAQALGDALMAHHGGGEPLAVRVGPRQDASDAVGPIPAAT
ncbi:MAG: photosynthetic complex putative assembly protein PuhB [Pseudomonadota bacterium]